jgi:hypothetical protein
MFQMTNILYTIVDDEGVMHQKHDENVKMRIAFPSQEKAEEYLDSLPHGMFFHIQPMKLCK